MGNLFPDRESIKNMRVRVFVGIRVYLVLGDTELLLRVADSPQRILAVANAHADYDYEDHEYIANKDEVESSSCSRGSNRIMNRSSASVHTQGGRFAKVRVLSQSKEIRFPPSAYSGTPHPS
jgi:hypothetical protein